MRAFLPALLVLSLLAIAAPAPAAAQGEEVDILEVRIPDRTMAGKAFEVQVDLRNNGPARTVYLFAALYEGEGEGEAPCGPRSDPRFRTYTPLVQAVVRLPANGAVTFPAEGDRWQHRYAAEHVEDAPSLNEFCVFAAESEQPPHLEWLDFESLRLSTRVSNAPPVADFMWEPTTPRATEDVVFRATGSDDEGDPVTFAWDFGHHNATGRAKAEGANATHFFYPEGTYTVTLTASDGLEETVVQREVRVLAQDAPAPEPAPTVRPQEGDDRWIPMPVTLVLLGALAAAALSRSTTRRGRSPPAPPRRR